MRVLTGVSNTDGETSYILYDDKERPLRSYTQNHYGGYTYTDSKLTFSGLPEYTITRHKAYATSSEFYTKDVFTYTDQDRLLTQTHQIGTSGTPQLMSKNDYDLLGQLKNKKVGGSDITAATYYQKVDFTYNIRGWMKGINNTAALDESGVPNDLFAFKLNYNTTEGSASGVSPMYNGNISETYWRTGSDNTLRKYGYGYDQLNRMTSAIYQKPLGSVPVTNSYNETVSYDKNGNITSLQRNGIMDSQTTKVQIDDLNYSYLASSNLLMRVHDKSNSLEGFADDIDDIDDAIDDYAYDSNGNMIKDANKKISSITYNHLNLPVTITFDIPGTNSISYTYDATGVKKSKLAIIDGAIEPKTDYISGFQYISGVLQFFPTAEGYVKKTGKHYNYVFTYKDHLGNTRLSYGMDPGGLSVLHILEENNYYPFGLKHQNYNATKLDFIQGMSGIELAATLNPLYQYKYNGKELQQEFDLNWYDYQARNYDPAIGRWMNIDPLAETSRRFSPYVYALNNPVRFIDPDGMEADDVVDMEGEMGGKKVTPGGGDSNVLAKPPVGIEQVDGAKHVDQDGSWVFDGKTNTWVGQNGSEDISNAIPLEEVSIEVTNNDLQSSEQDLELLKLMAVPLIISQADSPAIGPADLVAIAAMLLIYEHYHPSITTIGLYDEVSRGFIDSMKKKKEYDSDESEHRKKTPSKEEKHEKGQKRKQRDKGGEKGDKNRPYRRK